jgi:hypothetical protein
MYKIACLLLMFPLLGHAEISSLDNLRTFFTPKQVRTQLDELRASGKYSGNPSSTSLLREPVKVKMQGVVIRNGKTPVVFVNDENTLKTHHLSNDLTVRDHKVKKQGYKIPVRVNQQGVTLKPGQQWDESSRKVEDSYRIKQSNHATNASENPIIKAQNTIDGSK